MATMRELEEMLPGFYVMANRSAGAFDCGIVKELLRSYWIRTVRLRPFEVQQDRFQRLVATHFELDVAITSIRMRSGHAAPLTDDITTWLRLQEDRGNDVESVEFTSHALTFRFSQFAELDVCGDMPARQVLHHPAVLMLAGLTR